MQEDLSPEKNINQIAGATYRLLTTMEVIFYYMAEGMFSKLIISMIRQRLEYAVVVWSPHLKKQRKIGEGPKDGY